MRFLTIVGILLLCAGAAFSQSAAADTANHLRRKRSKASIRTRSTRAPTLARTSINTHAETGRSRTRSRATRSRWGQFNKLAENNKLVLYGLLTDAAKPGKHSPIEQKVGDYFAACMDTKTIEARGTEPLKANLDAIAKVTTRPQLMRGDRGSAAERRTRAVGFLRHGRHARCDDAGGVTSTRAELRCPTATTI